MANEYRPQPEIGASMGITMQYFYGCPIWQVMDTRLKTRLRTMIDSGSLDATVRYQLIEIGEATAAPED